MIDVSVDISGIIMYCDESVLGLNIGHGYSFEKVYWDEMPYKEKVTDGREKLDVAYMGSRLKDNKGEFFICLKKHDVFQIHEPELVPGVVYPIDGPMGCEQLEPYKECEMAYLYKVFALLHLFHEGNIGFYEIFFDYTYKTLGAINNKVNHISQSRSRNIVDQRRYILSEQAQGDCNQFLIDYKGLPFSLLKTSIDEFVWGMEQIDIPTGFEQYTTALEMTLLEKDAQNKKKMLANRVAILIGSSPTDITQIHAKMLSYYRFRSESLHEGSGANISIAELHSLEEYVRSVLKKYLARCEQEIAVNPAITWEEIKQKMITELKTHVITAKSAGILPA